MMKSTQTALFRIRPSIILFGDSITQQAFGINGGIGWASLLASVYSRRADVLNRGFSGYNTKLAVDQLLHRVFTGPIATSFEATVPPKVPPKVPPNDDGLEILPQSKALFCTVFFGANDASLPGGIQHVPIEVYEENLVKIVQHIQVTLGPDTPIVLLTAPPFDGPAWMAFRQISTPGRSNEVAKAYGEKVKQVASSYNLALVDTWTLLEGDSDKKTDYLSDGLHLNEQGNRLVFKGIMKALSKRYPDVLPMEDGDGKYGTSGIPLEEELWERTFNLN